MLIASASRSDCVRRSVCSAAVGLGSYGGSSTRSSFLCGFSSKTRRHSHFSPSRRHLNLLSADRVSERQQYHSGVLVSSSSRQQQNRHSTSHVHSLPKGFVVGDAENARSVVASLTATDRELLMDALHADADLHAAESTPLDDIKLSRAHVKQLFLFTSVPFIGFGLLDNLLMIVAGEYIDHTLGVFLGISTMAAAGLGNIISDVAGIGTAHYVEMIGNKLGITRPVMTPAQWNAKQTRFVINVGRSLGLILGCFVGMFPLFFFNEKAVQEKKRKAHKDE